MLEIKIINHYGTDDPEFEGDYYQIEIFINDELIQTYGDYYHDKGWEKAEGFMDGIKAITDDYTLTKEDIADYEV